ncbi:MAG TPA: hypothetical protein VMN57_08145 [Anaerolineales bacterium]|nr:hypothetical protein [Anaerolineales bacterium]
MNDRNLETDPFETWVAEHARRFRYPATPAPRPIPLAANRRRSTRRAVLVWAALLLVLLLGAFSPPSVRAAVVEFFQVGVMRIFFDDPGIRPESGLPLLHGLSGRTTLEEAAATAGIPVRYPEALGEPDEVYTQTIEGPLVLMVWFEGDTVEATLLALGPGAFAGKGAPQVMRETRVNEDPAFWLEGDHPLYLKTADDGYSYVTLFEAGNVLLWEAGEITYRLEGYSDMDTALRIAETLTGTP